MPYMWHDLLTDLFISLPTLRSNLFSTRGRAQLGQAVLAEHRQCALAKPLAPPNSQGPAHSLFRGKLIAHAATDLGCKLILRT